MSIATSAKAAAHRLWVHAVRFCEAKEKIEEMRKRARVAVESASLIRQTTEKELSEAKLQAQAAMEAADRDKTDAERGAVEKRAALNALHLRIDAEATPIAQEMISKVRNQSESAIRKAEKAKNFAESWSEVIQKRIECYESDACLLSFEDMEKFREVFENCFFNTERKKSAIRNELDKWMKQFRKRVEEDKELVSSLSVKMDRNGCQWKANKWMSSSED